MNEAIDPGNRRRPLGGLALLLVLASVQFTHVLDFMLLMPLGPRYLRELAIAPAAFGVLVSAYAASACVSGLLAAFFIDRFDRKRALLGLYLGFTLGTLLCALADGYWTLLVGRCVAGAFGGIMGALVMTIVGDAFPEERRGLATGAVMSAFSVATIAGIPAALALAAWLGTAAPFAVLAALAGVLFLSAAYLLPPMRAHLGREHPAVSLGEVLARPEHLWALVLMTCLVAGTFTFTPYLAPFLTTNVGVAEIDLSWIYLVGGLATLFTLTPMGRVADALGKEAMFRVMAVLTMVPVVVLTTMGPSSLAWAALWFALLLVISSGRMVPALALITSSARPAYRGRFMSLVASVQQAAMALGAWIGGILLSQPAPDAPIEGYPVVGLLACVGNAVGLLAIQFVRPAADEGPALLAEAALDPAPARASSAMTILPHGVKGLPAFASEDTMTGPRP